MIERTTFCMGLKSEIELLFKEMVHYFCEASSIFEEEVAVLSRTKDSLLTFSERKVDLEFYFSKILLNNILMTLMRWKNLFEKEF